MTEQEVKNRLWSGIGYPALLKTESPEAFFAVTKSLAKVINEIAPIISEGLSKIDKE